CLQYDNLLLTF
nr:immunoglobulin light chain junction region [Mus musculus]